MTNREKYAEEILDIACEGRPIALHKLDRKLVACGTLPCDECAFRSQECEGCNSNVKEWCNAEYKEPEPKVDWSKVEVDTPVLVSNDKETWRRRYFSKYKDGKVLVWSDGKTSWSIDGCPLNLKEVSYFYTKLAESEE